MAISCILINYITFMRKYVEYTIKEINIMENSNNKNENDFIKDILYQIAIYNIELEQLTHIYGGKVCKINDNINGGFHDF